MSQNTDKSKELWLKMARQEFPTYTDVMLENIKWEVALEWGSGRENKNAALYDKYVMMKRLLDIKPDTD